MSASSTRRAGTATFLVGLALGINATAGTALLLYTGRGFLRATGVLLASLIAALAAGLWVGGEGAGDVADPAARRPRWILVLLAYLAAALAALGWTLMPALHASPLAAAGAMLLVLVLPAYATGLLLGYGTTDPGTTDPGTAGVAALAGVAIAVFLGTTIIIPRIDPPLAFALAATLVFLGVLMDSTSPAATRPSPVAIISGVGAPGQLAPTLARRFLDTGYRITLTGRSETALAERAAELGSDRVHTAAADLLREDDARRVVAETLAKFGRIDALVNAAGGLTLVRTVADTTAAELGAEIERNLVTTLNLTRAALPALREARGAIVNFTSPAAAAAPASLGAYSAAKAGVAALTQALAREEAAHGVRVNAIAPGMMDTAQNRAAEPARSRWLRLDDVAYSTLFLCSDAAAAVTGEVLRLAGERPDAEP